MQLEQLLEESTRNKVHVHTMEAMRVEMLSRADALEAAQRDTEAKRQETEQQMAEFCERHEREKLELEREREALAKGRRQYQKDTDAEREREEERDKAQARSNELEQKNEALKMVIEKKTLQVKSAQIPPSCTHFRRPISQAILPRTLSEKAPGEGCVIVCLRMCARVFDFLILFVCGFAKTDMPALTCIHALHSFS